MASDFCGSELAVNVRKVTTGSHVVVLSLGPSAPSACGRSRDAVEVIDSKAVVGGGGIAVSDSLIPASLVAKAAVLDVLAKSGISVGVEFSEICEDDGGCSESCAEAASLDAEDPVSSAVVEADARLLDPGPEFARAGVVVAVESVPEDSKDVD